MVDFVSFPIGYKTATPADVGLTAGAWNIGSQFYKDASGNVGLGTGAYTLASAFQLGRVTSFAHDVNSGYQGAGWIGTSTPNYAVTGNYAVRTIYNSAVGQIIFQTAPTGTAGNAVTFTDRATIDANGLTIPGLLILAGDTLRVGTQKTPASASAAGVKGDIVHDASYIYICTATNTWKRAAIATW